MDEASGAKVPPISDVALLAAHNIHSLLGDPRMTYVAAMTAAAITGHMIGHTREQMHETLDTVFDVAMAKIAHRLTGGRE